MWIDIASIVFETVTMNHLGLIKAIEEKTDRELLILNCPKCSTFWATLVYQLLTLCNPISSLAVSFLASYIAIWLELLEGFIDTLYLKLYEKIYADNTDDATASVRDESDTDGSVS